MRPLRVTMRLRTPPVLPYPMMLDALLVYGQGARMGAAAGVLVPWEEVDAAGLPLARVEGPAGWWWACSQVTPHGEERPVRKNYRPTIEAQARWTSEKRVNVASGPDKALRTQHYARIGMLRMEWTCIGDRGEVEALLSWCACVGKLGTDGWGAIHRLEVVEDDTAPPLSAYASDVTIRHLPVEAVRGMPPETAQVTRRSVPLRAPYYRTDLAPVPCMQVSALWSET